MPIDYKECKIHPTVIMWHPELVNIYGDTTIGKETRIGSFVNIGNAKIGVCCKIEDFAFIPPGTIIEDYVFIGPHACLTNDKHPDLTKKEWKLEPVIIKHHAIIGANATICPGVTVGEHAFVKANANVIHDVPAHVEVQGNPAKIYKRNKKD